MCFGDTITPFYLVLIVEVDCALSEKAVRYFWLIAATSCLFFLRATKMSFSKRLLYSLLRDDAESWGCFDFTMNASSIFYVVLFRNAGFYYHVNFVT